MRTKSFALALGLTAALFTLQPALAACSSARVLTSSYIYTPGTTYTYAVSGNTVTDQLAGTWWALGYGDPASPGGADSGTYPALDWMANSYTGYGYPAYVSTTWSRDVRLDDCIDETPATCTGMQLTDIDPGTGESVFALLSAEQDEFKNYSFGLGDRIDLVPIPAFEITNSTRDGADHLYMDLLAPDATAFGAGVYLDPACTGASGGEAGVELFLSGVRWVFLVLPRGSALPEDTDVVRGGWVDSGVSSSFGSAATLHIPCDGGDSDVYVSYVFVNESDMPVMHTAPIPARRECGPNIADPDERVLRAKPRNPANHDTRRR